MFPTVAPVHRPTLIVVVSNLAQRSLPEPGERPRLFRFP